jgi:hypothetical protein
LRHLRKFSFGDYFSEWKFDLKIILKCAQYLPHLKVVGRDLQNLDIWMVDSMEEECYFDQIICQPLQLGLEQLMLSRDNFPHEKFSVPDLKELHLMCPRGDVIGLCNRYEGVSRLALYETEEKLILKILQSVGRRLTTLVLVVTEKEMSLPSMLQFCPCLEQLKIEDVPLEMCHKPWPRAVTLDCLQQVDLHFRFTHRRDSFLTTLLTR